MEPRRPNITAVVIGMLLTMLLLIALRYLAIKRGREPIGVPALTIVAPNPNSAVDSPLIVRFSSSQPIALHPTGWGTGQLHLHARVNGAEHMPAANDISRADATYAWTLHAVGRGPFIVQIGWADRHHRELATGKTAPMRGTLE